MANRQRMSSASFIIHLDRAVGRKSQVTDLGSVLPEPVRVMDAVDGQRIDPALTAYRRLRWFPPYPFRLRCGEIGAFMSHRAVWQTIVDDGLDWALIVEDDVAIDPGRFDQALQLALAHFDGSSVVRFPVDGYDRHGPTIARDGDIRLLRPYRPGLGMFTQLVGREAARRLLDATEIFDRPVDSALQMHWKTGVRLLAVTPSGVSHISASLGGSAIHQRKSAVSRISHEMLRPLYRGWIALRSQIDDFA
jgi:GR25 family glycosyltransferase involved in LPS biosynthesis